MSTPPDHLEQFEEWMRSWSAAPTTAQSRLSVLRTYLREWGDLDEVTPETLARWLSNPAFSAWTRQTYFYHARSYFGWLADSGRIPADPSAKLRVPKSPRDKPRPLTDDQVELILSRSNGNLHSWLLIALLSGLRCHEIAKLRGQDITEEEIFVLGKGRKEATIPTHPELWALAKTLPRGGWLFPAQSMRSITGHVAGTSITTIVSTFFRSLGIEGSIHRCRHTYATQLLRNGANIRVVQTLMRHESLATTAKYTGVNVEECAAAILGLNPRRAS